MQGGKYKQLIVALCLALFSTGAWPVAGWTSYGSVTELIPTTAGRFLVKLDVASNPSGCKNKQWFYQDYSGTGADYIFRALLATLGTDQKVRVYVTGSCDLKGYSEISSASVIP